MTNQALSGQVAVVIGLVVVVAIACANSICKKKA